MFKFLYFFLVTLLTIWTLYSLFFFTFFWYEAVNGGYWEKIGEKYSINLKVFTVRAIFTSIFNLARVWWYWSYRYVSRYWILPDDKPHHVPVVFVHGYLHNRSAWVKYFKWLKDLGYTHLLAIDLKGKFSAIEEYAEQLSVEVDKLLEKYNVEKVDIVAHSMGGLVVRYYIQKLEGCKKVRKVVTLGTPHNGTKVGVFVAGRARPQMLPNSDFLKGIKLNSLDALSGTELTVLCSDADFMIVPTHLARVDIEGVPNICVGLVSHIGFIYDKHVFQEVLSALRTD